MTKSNIRATHPIGVFLPLFLFINFFFPTFVSSRSSYLAGMARCKSIEMIFYFLIGALSLGSIDCEEKWSLPEGEAIFDPGFTVLENWTSITERNEKIMKNPSDRYIVTKPTREPSGQSANSKEVSETDLFLLGAIEKLAYRLDFMEKRLRRTEEMIYQLISESQPQINEKEDPCPEHFVRLGGDCFHVSTKQLNWKSASSTCRNLGSALVEFETPEEENLLTASFQLDANYREKDYWTGGLNPGLLWIWSNSAKPIQNQNNQIKGLENIEGNGRCLVMAFQPPTKKYRYKGADCSKRNYFVCKYMDNLTGRQLERLERALKLKNESS